MHLIRAHVLDGLRALRDADYDLGLAAATSEAVRMATISGPLFDGERR